MEIMEALSFLTFVLFTWLTLKLKKWEYWGGCVVNDRIILYALSSFHVYFWRNFRLDLFYSNWKFLIVYVSISSDSQPVPLGTKKKICFRKNIRGSSHIHIGTKKSSLKSPWSLSIKEGNEMERRRQRKCPGMKLILIVGFSKKNFFLAFLTIFLLAWKKNIEAFRWFFGREGKEAIWVSWNRDYLPFWGVEKVLIAVLGDIFMWIDYCGYIRNIKETKIRNHGESSEIYWVKTGFWQVFNIWIN